MSGVLVTLMLAAIAVGIFAASRFRTRPQQIDKAKDPEFDEKHRHLDLFMQSQELLLLLGGSKPSFASEREKLRYMHFVFGAIDQLSRTIKNEERSELWSMTTSLARAALLFGVDDAMSHVEIYGRSGDSELHSAGERGWRAMHTYIRSAIGKASEEDFRMSCTELAAVVRGQEPYAQEP